MSSGLVPPPPVSLSAAPAPPGSGSNNGWLITGGIKEYNGSGKAELSIPVHGPIHKGTIHVSAEKSKGQWTYQQLTLSVGGQCRPD